MWEKTIEFESIFPDMAVSTLRMGDIHSNLVDCFVRCAVKSGANAAPRNDEGFAQL
jgi:hypothetical protein